MIRASKGDLPGGIKTCENKDANDLERLASSFTAPIPPMHPELVACSRHRYKHFDKRESTQGFLLHAKEFSGPQNASPQASSLFSRIVSVPGRLVDKR